MPDFTGTLSLEAHLQSLQRYTTRKTAWLYFVSDALSVVKQCAFYEKKKLLLVQCQCTAGFCMAKGGVVNGGRYLRFQCAGRAFAVSHCNKLAAQLPASKGKKRSCYTSRKSLQLLPLLETGHWTSPKPVTKLKETGVHFAHCVLPSSPNNAARWHWGNIGWQVSPCTHPINVNTPESRHSWLNILSKSSRSRH